MKQKMIQVTPKAGTLKQISEKVQNSTRKLVASVLMLAVVAMTPISIMAEGQSGDSCCNYGKTNKLPGSVVLSLPSAAMVNKADSEINSNLYRSLRESRVAGFKKAFTAADAEINRSFTAETTVSGFNASAADDNIAELFAAENLAVTLPMASADQDINDIFTAENLGVKANWNTALADAEIGNDFHAENLSIPGNDHYCVADAEINRNMQADQSVKLAKLSK